MSRRPHLILVCVDALRADCFHNESPVWRETGRPRTPALDSFRSRAHTWDRAFASSSWTKPSVPSMIMSLHPSEHGVLEVERVEDDAAAAAALPDGTATLAEMLRDVGYRTIGLAHNAQLDPSLGFDRGFDLYTCEAGVAHEIVDRVLALSPWESGPSFVHLHLIDPHWPFASAVGDQAEAHMEGRFAFHRMRAAEWKQLKDDLKSGRVTPTPAETRFLRRVYRLAVEETDRALGRLFDGLADRGVLEESVVIFTADHGEELLDRGLIGHGQSLFDELIRVPLWMRVGRDTGLPGAGKSAKHPDVVSHVDLLPTLATAAGMDVTHRVAGRSLLTEKAPDFVYSEVKHKRRYRQAVTDGRWKLVRNYIFERELDDAGRSRPDTNNLEELFAGRPHRVERELFDLRRDPRELTDRSHADLPVAERLEAALDRWWEGRSPRGQHTRALEEELIRRLEALGYL